MKSARVSLVAQVREQYAHGEITYDELEGRIVVALHAEAISSRRAPKVDRSPEACAARYAQSAPLSSGAWTQAITSGVWAQRMNEMKGASS